MDLFNKNDLAWVECGFRITTVIEPSRDGPIFQGKIWILTNERTSSAAEVATLFSKYAGFAVIVGETTRGVTGGGTTSGRIVMPNTGILIRYDLTYKTDSRGRALDEIGVLPHHHICPDEDAFDVVKMLILERASLNN